MTINKITLIKMKKGTNYINHILKHFLSMHETQIEGNILLNLIYLSLDSEIIYYFPSFYLFVISKFSLISN